MSLVQIENTINLAVSMANDNTYYYVSPSVPPYGWDCSGFVLHCFETSGVDIHGATYTGDMLQKLTIDNTFTAITFDLSIAQRGDIFLVHDPANNKEHTVIYLGNNQIVHAANSSIGIVVASYYANSYQYILRLTNQLPYNYQWHAKRTGYYNKEDIEAQENAIMIYSTLAAYGWTLQAVCGMLGNIAYESAYNPWRWEGDVVISSTDSYNISVATNHGYGLVQFTPASKYVWNSAAQSMQNFSPNYSDIPGTPEDGRAQCEYINSYADYYPTTTWPQSYSDFKAWTGSAEDAASIWIHNYERPQSYSTENNRRTTAAWWYNFLGGITPPQPTRKTKLPIWLIMKIVRKDF